MKQQQDPQKYEVLVLRKIHLVIMILTAIGSTVLSAYASYSRSLSAMNEKIEDIRFESARDGVSKSDLAELRDALKQIRADQMVQGQDIARIKGLLERRR